MSKLLIIGNGFDLKLGVPSKFEDYFNYCINNNSEIENIIQRIKSYKLISQSSNEEVYQKNYSQLKEEFNLLYKYNDVNLWFMILYITLNYNYNKNWSDIESNIYSFLIVNRTVFDLKSTINRVIFRKRFNNSIIQDLEVYSYFLHFKYKALNNSDYNIYEYLMMELKEFESSFSSYLSKEIKGNEYYKKSNELFSKLVDINEDFNVLNFNYTNPEKYNSKSRLKYITNVHGSLRKKNIIIGIDYKELDIDTNLQLDAFSFTKTSRIIHNIKNVNTFNNALLDKTINEIIVFGHSLSDADYSYYQSVFDYYDLYHSSIKLCFKYSVYDSNKRNQIKTEQSNRVIKLILDYGSTMDNKDNGKNLLHKLLLEDRLLIEVIN